MKSINLMKNIGRFTPPETAKSDLPSNRLYDLLNIKNLYVIILSIFRVHF